MVEGIGVILIGTSLTVLIYAEHTANVDYTSIYTDFLGVLEAGVVLAGIGVIVVGLGLYRISNSR